jgi:hypothetical protein
VQLDALERELDEVLVVLQDIELEVVVLEHPDAVEVALGKVLELARLLAQLEQDLVAVERALALATGLEVVGHLLEPSLAVDQRAPADGRVSALALDRHAVVEVDQGLLVRAIAQRRVPGQRLPGRGRRLVLLGLLEADRGMHRHVLLGVELRRLAPALLHLEHARALGRSGFAREAVARQVEVVKVEIDVAGLAAALEVAVDLGQPAQPVVVLVVDDVGLRDELAVGALRLGQAALRDQPLGQRRGALDRAEAVTRHARPPRPNGPHASATPCHAG